MQTISRDTSSSGSCDMAELQHLHELQNTNESVTASIKSFQVAESVMYREIYQKHSIFWYRMCKGLKIFTCSFLTVTCIVGVWFFLMPMYFNFRHPPQHTESPNAYKHWINCSDTCSRVNNSESEEELISLKAVVHTLEKEIASLKTFLEQNTTQIHDQTQCRREDFACRSSSDKNNTSSDVMKGITNFYETLKNMQAREELAMDTIQKDIQQLKDHVKINNVTSMTMAKDLEELNSQYRYISSGNTSFDSFVVGSLAAKIDAMESRLKFSTKYPRCCQEYITQGITKSGNYKIDPDGYNFGVPPFTVYCNFQTGTTEISHKQRGSNIVTLCNKGHCYNLKLSYHATVDEMTALATTSVSCQQYIKFDCYLAPLENIGYWVDRYGDHHSFFNGFITGGHHCSCATNNTCTPSPTKKFCNCDVSHLPKWQFDDGYITNKSLLPVASFKYGFLTGKANITVGNFSCKGLQKPDNPTSCTDLRLSGHDTSGYYIVNTTIGKPQLIFCDMANVTNVHNPSGYLLTSKRDDHKPISQAFLISESSFYSRQWNKMGKVNVSLGEKYWDDGNFNVPLTGIYQLLVNGQFSYDVHEMKLQIEFVRGQETVKCNDRSCVLFVTTYLAIGDVINVKLLYIRNHYRSNLIIFGPNNPLNIVIFLLRAM